MSAKETCIQPPSAIEEFNRYVLRINVHSSHAERSSGPNQALLERISFLEAQLAAYANATSTDHGENDNKHAPSLDEIPRPNSLPEIVGFLSLGGEAAYVGASSGFSLATNLGQMVQATVWNKGWWNLLMRSMSGGILK